ncbi:MAG: hypothetical protein ACRDHZ_18790 [Ktedonobacteraceae bacterium]
MKKYRKIVIDGQTYFWKFTPGYVQISEVPMLWECHDRFIAYLQCMPKIQLQVHFRTWEDATIGGPLHVGASLNVDGSGMSEINLHTPGWAAWLIRQALAAGWQPVQSQLPFVIAQGVDFLRAKITDQEKPSHE